MTAVQPCAPINELGLPLGCTSTTARIEAWSQPTAWVEKEKVEMLHRVQIAYGQMKVRYAAADELLERKRPVASRVRSGCIARMIVRSRVK